MVIKRHKPLRANGRGVLIRFKTAVVTTEQTCKKAQLEVVTSIVAEPLLVYVDLTEGGKRILRLFFDIGKAFDHVNAQETPSMEPTLLACCIHQEQ